MKRSNGLSNNIAGTSYSRLCIQISKRSSSKLENDLYNFKFETNCINKDMYVDLPCLLLFHVANAILKSVQLKIQSGKQKKVIKNINSMI